MNTPRTSNQPVPNDSFSLAPRFNEGYISVHTHQSTVSTVSPPSPFILLLIAALFSLTFSLPAAPTSSPPAPAPQQQKQEVVVYTALDEIFSEPLLKQFETRTGIRVKAVYDTESAKTVGLVNRLLSERPRPQCDVFWNNEILRTLLLKRQGATQPYTSPQSEGFPVSWRDPQGHWTAFAARARVIIYNTKLVSSSQIPRRIEDLSLPQWSGRCAIANPLFGTTATQAAAQWSLWGPSNTQKYFQSLRANKVAVVPGNATVRDQVALGELAWGLTDSDDANGALLDNRPVGVLFPEFTDVVTSSTGMLLIPNAVSLIRNCPHPETGKQLIDYLLSPEVEIALSQSRSAQLPLRPGLPSPPGWKEMATRKPLSIDWEKTLDSLEPSARWLHQEFVP